MKILRAIVPHLTIMLSIAFVVLWILDYFNPMMQFLSGNLPKALLLLLLLCAVVSSILLVQEQRK